MAYNRFDVLIYYNTSKHSIPANAPDGEYIIALTPIKRPRESKRGPPLLPMN